MKHLSSHMMQKCGQRYHKLFFKLLLFAVYVAFFSVQLFCRFATTQTFANSEAFSYNSSKAAQVKTADKKIPISLPKRHYKSVYLNKHYQPETVLFLETRAFHFSFLYKEVSSAFHIYDENIKELHFQAPFLRGPPSLA